MRDIHLVCEDFEGNDKTKGYEGKIQLLGYRHEFSRSVNAVPGGNVLRRPEGRANWGDFIVWKNPDKASPKMALYCAAGKKIATLAIELADMTEGAQHRLRVYEMTDVYISKFAVKTSEFSQTDEFTPFELEEIHFNFATITWKIKPDKDAAEVVTAFDREQNAPKE